MIIFGIIMCIMKRKPEEREGVETMDRERKLLEHLCLEVIKFYVKQMDFVSANYVSKALAEEWESILHLAHAMQVAEAERELVERVGMDMIYRFRFLDEDRMDSRTATSSAL